MTTTNTELENIDWTDVAAGWDTYRGHVETAKAELTERLLAGLDLKSGEQVLELGAGTGELARRLAEAVGVNGRVLVTDVAAGMVDLIAATTADLPNVEVAQLDAADTGRPDASYDAIAIRMGLMFLADPGAAVRDFHRVLKPGGRLAVATWAAPEHNPWLVCVGMAAMLNGLVSGGLPIAPGGPLSLSDPTALGQLARDAGFSSVTVHEVETPCRAGSVDEHIAWVSSLAPPLAVGFAAATDEQLVAVRKSVAEMMGQYETADGFVIPGRALLLVASR